MENKNKEKLLTPTFAVSAGICLVLAVVSLVSSSTLSSVLTLVQMTFAIEYSWLAQILPLLCFGLLLVLGFSKKYGHIKLGGANAVPQYSTFTWIGMLFTSAIGMGLMAFAVNEPLYAYLLAPSSLDAASEMEAAKQAMISSMYHWGASTWAISALAGMIVAYFVSRHGGRYLPGDAIARTWPNTKWAKPMSVFVNILACVAAAATISASMGLGVVQLTSGIAALFSLPDSVVTAMPYFFLIALALLSMLAATTKTVGKGMSMISNFNVYVCLFVLMFALVFGPTRFMFENIIQTTGAYIDSFIARGTDMFIFGTDPSLASGTSYLTSWDVVNNLFWVCWAPFLSVFIASISHGRTFKEFALCTTIIPTIFMLIWNGGLGGITLLDTLLGEGAIAANVLVAPDLTFFMILEELPLTTLMTLISVLLLFMFLMTTVTSATLSLGRMTDSEGMNAKPIRCMIWVVLMACIAMTSLVAAAAGGADALVTIKAIGSTFGYPYLFFFLLTTFAFLRRLKLDEIKDPTPRLKG